MNGGILRSAIAAPLTSPQAAPAAIAVITPRTTGAPLTIARAPITPDSAITEPTDRSIPPDTITIVIPIAMTVITAVWRATPARLPAERNLGSSAAISMHSATRLTNGRKRFIQSDIAHSYEDVRQTFPVRPVDPVVRFDRD